MKNKEFSDIFKEVVSENYNGNLSDLSRGAPRRDKYFPPTIEVAPSASRSNGAISMGQSERETDAPPQLAYPFDAIFNLLVGDYVNLTTAFEMIQSSQRSSILSSTKKDEVDSARKKLVNIIKDLKEVIQTIETISI